MESTQIFGAPYSPVLSINIFTNMKPCLINERKWENVCLNSFLQHILVWYKYIGTLTVERQLAHVCYKNHRTCMVLQLCCHSCTYFLINAIELLQVQPLINIGCSAMYFPNTYAALRTFKFLTFYVYIFQFLQRH